MENEENHLLRYVENGLFSESGSESGVSELPIARLQLLQVGPFYFYRVFLGVAISVSIGMSEHNALLRYGSLGLLVAQDTALVLLLRSSRDTSKHTVGPMYLASTAVLLMEIVKLMCCGLMVLKTSAEMSCGKWLKVVRTEVLDPWEILKLSVPAVLYLLQNNLLYFALSHLRATPYKVTYNLKANLLHIFMMHLTLMFNSK